MQAVSLLNDAKLVAHICRRCNSCVDPITYGCTSVGGYMKMNMYICERKSWDMIESRGRYLFSLAWMTRARFPAKRRIDRGQCKGGQAVSE